MPALVPHQHILHLPLGLGDDLFDQQLVFGVGGLREDTDAHLLLRQRLCVHIMRELADNVGLRADLFKPSADGTIELPQFIYPTEFMIIGIHLICCIIQH